MIDDGRRAATFYFIPRNSARKLLEHLASLKEEEDPKKEIFPKTAFFGSFTIMRIEWRRKEGRRTHARVRRQSRMQIGDSRRPRSSRRTEEEEEEEEGEEVELGEGEKELSFPLSFIVFSGLFGWSPSFSLTPLVRTHFCSGYCSRPDRRMPSGIWN